VKSDSEDDDYKNDNDNNNDDDYDDYEDHDDDDEEQDQPANNTPSQIGTQDLLVPIYILNFEMEECIMSFY